MANRGEEEIRWIDGVEGAAGGGGEQPLDLVRLLAEVEFDDDYDDDEEEDSESLAMYQKIMDPSLNIDLGNTVVTINEPKRRTLIGNIISSNNIVSWFKAPFSSIWSKYMRKKTMDRNSMIVMEFVLRLYAFYGERPMPPDINEIMEAIIGNYPPEIIQSVNPENRSPDGSKVDNLSKPIVMEPYATKVLRKLLLVTIDVLPYMGDLTLKIREQLDLEGLIHSSTPEYTLCVNSCTKMMQLVKRLDVLQSLIREYLPMSKKFEEIRDACKISVAWIREERSAPLSEITFSVASHMQLLYETTYESIIKMVACICYFIEVPEVNSYQYSKLLLISVDLTLLIKELRDGLRTIVAIYENAVDRLRRSSILEIDMNRPLRPSYEREDRLKRQCGHLVSWAHDFAEHAKLLEVTAERAVDLKWDRGQDSYQKVTEELKGLRGATESYLKQFHSLMAVNSMLTQQLLSEDEHVHEPSEQAIAIREDERKETSPATNSNEPNNADPTEFENVATVENGAAAAEEPPLENRDEVFLRIGGEEDDNGPSALEHPEDDDEGKLAHLLYSGVLSQLKTALVPVKTEMKQREKEAMKKFLISMNDSEILNFEDIYGDDTVEKDEKVAQETSDGNPEQEISNGEAPPVVVPRKKFNKYNAIRDEQEADFTSSTTFANGDLLKELRSKLSTASEFCFLAEPNDDELTCDSFSEESTLVEETGEQKSETNEN